MSQEYSNSVYSHDKEPWQRMVLHLTNKLKPICENIEIFLTIKTRADQSKEEENPLRLKGTLGSWFDQISVFGYHGDIWFFAFWKVPLRFSYSSTVATDLTALLLLFISHLNLRLRHYSTDYGYLREELSARIPSRWDCKTGTPSRERRPQSAASPGDSSSTARSSSAARVVPRRWSTAGDLQY